MCEAELFYVLSQKCFYHSTNSFPERYGGLTLDLYNVIKGSSSNILPAFQLLLLYACASENSGIFVQLSEI